MSERPMSKRCELLAERIRQRQLNRELKRASKQNRILEQKRKHAKNKQKWSQLTYNQQAFLVAIDALGYLEYREPPGAQSRIGWLRVLQTLRERRLVVYSPIRQRYYMSALGYRLLNTRLRRERNNDDDTSDRQ